MTIGMALPSIAFATIPNVNELVSVASDGTQGNNASYSSRHTVSGDGRFVVFASSASNFVTGDTNSSRDVFIRDRTNGTTTLVSASSSGAIGNSDSGSAAISYDGRYVVFMSAATNLVSGVTNGYDHIYLHDTQTGTTSIVDTTANGTVGISSAEYPDVSADGRFIVFDSSSSNLVSGINPIGVGSQIFLKDMSTGAIEALSVSSSGAEGNAQSDTAVIDCGGSVVAFYSGASNLVSNDTNGKGDVFVDVLGWSGNNLTDITLAGNGYSQDPAISCDGNQIAYDTSAGNLAPNLPASTESILEYNRLTDGTAVASADSSGTPASGTSKYPSVSNDGRYVSFQSDATTALDSSRTYNNPSGDSNIFIHDTKQETTQVITLNSSGQAVGGANGWTSISADGSIVSYADDASNLVANDSNGYQDIFDSETGF